MRAYTLVTVWRLQAPRDLVWEMLSTPQDWPAWWPHVERVGVIREGGRDGIGALHCHTWKTCLPYGLDFTLEVTEVTPKARVTVRVSGDLVGVGRCRLRALGPATLVRYDWHVHTARPWMNRLAPLTRTVFLWNHRRVMAAGETALQARLNQALAAAGRPDRPG